MSETLTTLGWIIVACAGYVVVMIVLNWLSPRRCPECSTGILEIGGGVRSCGGKRSSQIASGYRFWNCKQCARTFVDCKGKLILLHTDDHFKEADQIVFGHPREKESNFHD